MIKALGTWHYDVADKLGGGGYADVFACRGKTENGSRLEGALKIYRDATYANTLEREVAALEAIQGCPHTPALLDHGRDATGRLCIVTTRAHGRPLDASLRENGALSVAATLLLLRQMLAVLAFAHERGWLHKDLKASNLLHDGENFTLLDWGIAAPVGDGRAETIRSKNQDAVAPESYFGRHGPASDFYQLGLLACHALTGIMPYRLATVKDRDYRVAAHCLERPTLPDVPTAGLVALLGNWLDKNPNHRLLAYDLDTLLDMAPRYPADFSATHDFRQLAIDGGYLLGAARAGVPYAMHEWGVRLEKQGRIDEAAYWLKKAAQMAYLRSAYQLVVMAEKTGGPIDAQIEDYLHAAAAGGMVSAQYRLAERQRESENPAAIEWLRRAAAQGERRAQYRLARELAKTGASPAEVILWYGRAADRGDARAQARLARWSASPSGSAPAHDTSPPRS